VPRTACRRPSSVNPCTEKVSTLSQPAGVIAVGRL
jgi:hypothetical protein